MAIRGLPEEPQRQPLRHRNSIRALALRGRRRRESGAFGLGFAVLLVAAVAPIVLVVAAVGTVSIRALQFYDSTTHALRSPGAAMAAVADYGGAQIYDRNGTLLYRYLDKDQRVKIPVRLDGVSPYLANATVSTEDASFWNDAGLNVTSIAHAAIDNFRTSGDPFSGRGGSGITQQLVKQTLIPSDQRNERSIDRKAVEAIDAIQVAQQYPRSQILEWYLNVINYGGVYDGIGSAAEGYFGISAKDLDLAQAAMLAGIPQSPARYSPYLQPEAAKQRQAEVLDLMVKHGYITQDQADAAKAEKLTFKSTDQSFPLRAPWFVEYVKQQVIARVGENCFETCGLIVRTSLDINLEDQAQQILDKNLTTYGDPVGVHNGALLSIDARNGQILVMVGSRDYNDGSPTIQGNNNFATAILQPGSAFKPFVYLTLFMQKGYGPDSIIWDAPFTTADGYKCENPAVVGRNLGPIPVRLALASSLNCPANRAAAVAGVPNILNIARTMGITTLGNPDQYGPSIATGGANISLLDLAYGYTTLARNGSMIGTPPPDGHNTLRPLDPIAILEIKDAAGRSLYVPEQGTKQVVAPAYPYMVTSIISDCKNRRLIWPCGFPLFQLSDPARPVAAKTGTQQGGNTSDTQGNWQFMYTPDLVTGGWVGNANRTTWTDRNGGANAVGFSVQNLEDLITTQLNLPVVQFARPPEVLSVPVHVPDASLGLLGGCGPVEVGLFASGQQPDINNRICLGGRIVVPAEQVGTGGLQAYGFFSTPPAPPTAAATVMPSSTPSIPTAVPPGSVVIPTPTAIVSPTPYSGIRPIPTVTAVPTARPSPSSVATTPAATATPPH